MRTTYFQQISIAEVKRLTRRAPAKKEPRVGDRIEQLDRIPNRSHRGLTDEVDRRQRKLLTPAGGQHTAVREFPDRAHQ